MKLRRAISALGMAFALSFGLVLAPVQAQTLPTETLMASVRDNAVETGQVQSAPVGAVFTLTVHDVGLTGGARTVSYTVKTGDSLRAVARRLVNKINANAKLQAIGVQATLGNGSNYTITSASSNLTSYTQTATAGGVNFIAVQETLALGGSITVNDTLSLTIHDAGLAGGQETVSYKVKTGDALSDIVIRLRNKINSSTTLSALGISAKASPINANVLLIQSNTFDKFGRVTSYSSSASTGATERMTLGAFSGTNGQQVIRVGGTVTVGDNLSFDISDVALPGGKQTINYTVSSGASLSSIACGLSSSINSNSSLSALGITSSCGGAGSDLLITSTSSNAFGVMLKGNVSFPPSCTVVTPAPWSGVTIKRCGTASDTAVDLTLSTLNALIDTSQTPGGASAPDAAQRLAASNNITYYVYGNYVELRDSLMDSRTGGPPPEAFYRNPRLIPDRNARGASTTGFEDFAPFTIIFDFYTQDLVQNTKIPYTVAHETGHQLDGIYFDLFGSGFGTLSRSYANGAGYSTAVSRDASLMNELPVCRAEATDGKAVFGDPPVRSGGYYASSGTTEPGGSGGISGLFTEGNDSNNAAICNDRSSNLGSSSIDIIKNAYHGLNADGSNATGFFKRIYDEQDVGDLLVVAQEMFAEQYAVLVGFTDTKDNDGATVIGHDSAFDVNGGAGSNLPGGGNIGFMFGDLNPPTTPDPAFPYRIYGCSGLHVFQLAIHGEIPPSSRTSASFYPVPDTVPAGAPADAGMKGYGTTHKYCDGGSEYQGDYSFGS